MPANLPAEWYKVKREYDEAKTREEKIKKLKELLSVTPTHKGCENLRAQLKKQMARLKEKKGPVRSRKSVSVPKRGAAQVTIIGLPNSGKSTFLKKWTGAKPKIADYPYTTIKPEVGVMDYHDVKIQMVEIPSTFTPEVLNVAQNSDMIILLLDSRRDEKEQKEELKKVLEENLIDRRSIYIRNDEENVPEKVWKELGLMRIYTKNPGKKPEKKPLTLRKGSTVEDVARRIHKGFVEYFRFARIFGPSAKFPGEKVGLDHVLEDGYKEADKVQEAQVQVAQIDAGNPVQSPFPQQEVVDGPVGGQGDRQDEDDRKAQPDGGVDLLRTGEEGAHAQEVGQQDVFNKDCLNG